MLTIGTPKNCCKCIWLRGYCTPKPKLHVAYNFVLHLKIINTFLKYDIYILFYRKLSKELNNSIRTYKPSASSVTDPNNIFTVFIYNLKTTWPAKFPMPFCSTLGNLLYIVWCLIIFQEKCWQFWDRTQNRQMLSLSGAVLP